MTKKNRKARRLMELYPGVTCKILYQRDYLNLLVKYGLEEPSQGALLQTAEGPDGSFSIEQVLSAPSSRD
ncbi:MAG TPA: hypothetical protein VHV50_12140 [Actinomycetota bacterium]|nr:hypothetical protein [Actinomycetota bacterium]